MLFLQWLNEVRKQLRILITGSLLIGLLGIYQGISNRPVPPWMYAVSAAFFLAWAVFAAWARERILLEEERAALQVIEKKLYDGRPIFVLELNYLSGWSFHLQNCGSRPARYVELATQTSKAGRYDLHFYEVSVLEPNKPPVAVNWVVTESRKLVGLHPSQKALNDFLNDVPQVENPFERAVFIWFDVTIKYRDTDESVNQAIVRFCFDLDSQTMKAAAVPYTERKVNPAAPSK